MADVQTLHLFLKSRATYDRFADSVPQHLLEPDTRLLLKDVEHWYKANPKCDAILPVLAEFWSHAKVQWHANAKVEKLDLLKKLLQRAAKATVAESAGEILKTLTLRDHAAKLAEAADKFASGDMSTDIFEAVYDMAEAAKLEAGIQTDHDYEITGDFADSVREGCDIATGLTWRSNVLNKALGALRLGDLICCAAFVDTGKSTWLASEITNMAQQMEGDEKVLLFSNEERGEKVRKRFVRSACGATVQDMEDQPEALWAEYIERMGGDPFRIVLIDHHAITAGMVRKKLRQYNARLIAFDQLFKIRLGGSHGDDKLAKLQANFEWARGLAKQYAPVIAIHQARGDANGERYIEMNQLAGSQQALQGEPDAIITLGRDLDTPEARYIYVPKNKMERPGDEACRSIKAEVFPDFAHARFDS